ncbi:hypothetical protein [Comamonas sp. C24C]
MNDVFYQSSFYGGVGAPGTATDVAPVSALWADRVPLQTQVGRQVRFTDVGGGSGNVSGGTTMAWNGTRWRPLSGVVTLDAIDTANVGAADTTEQQLNPSHIAIPAGLIVDGDRIRIVISASKSGASANCTIRVRFGPAGTVADQLLTTISALSASNQSYNDIFDYKRTGATAIQQQGNQTYKGASSAAFPAPITVANMGANAMYMTISAQMGAATEAPTIQNYTLEWYPTDV